MGCFSFSLINLTLLVYTDDVRARDTLCVNFRSRVTTLHANMSVLEASKLATSLCLDWSPERVFLVCRQSWTQINDNFFFSMSFRFRLLQMFLTNVKKIIFRVISEEKPQRGTKKTNSPHLCTSEFTLVCKQWKTWGDDVTFCFKFVEMRHVSTT